MSILLLIIAFGLLVGLSVGSILAAGALAELIREW